MAFYNDLKTGKIAEEFTINEYYVDNLFDYQDVRDIQEYRNIDVDFIVTDLFFEKTWYSEVKGDWRIHDTGNMFIEYKLEYYDGSPNMPGWFMFTKTNELVYCDLVLGKIYLIDFKSLYEYVDTHRLKSVSCNNDRNKCSYGWLVNVDTFSDWLKANKKKNISIISADGYEGKLSLIKDKLNIR